MYRLQGDEQGWRVAGSIESKGRPGMGAAHEESARNLFKQMDLKGKAQQDTQLKTIHQNTIATVRAYEASGDTLKRISSECTIHLSI